MLFLCTSASDPSDAHLCDAMANMVAVVLALEPRSNHLWYHLFGVHELEDTFMTAFLVSQFECVLARV